MIYIFLSICCSVTVSALFKLARRYSIDVFQAITWNYSAAIILTLVFLKPQFSGFSNAPVYTYTLLGFLLPAVFIAVAASVRYTGIVRTDTAQRISLIIPLLAAYFYFGEQLSIIKSIGIVTGVIAVILLLSKPKERSYLSKSARSVWIYPLVVFIGFGVVDVLFKQLALVRQYSFATSLFAVYVIAFILALMGLIYLIVVKKTRLRFSHIGFGWVLGIANFGNILFYVKAHQALAANPSIVFSAMNIGVIAVGTVTGVVIFKEKTSWLNRIGIILAITAVIIITYTQLH